MSGTFGTWQPEYEARGIATFPLRSDDRKRPAVGNYNKMGMPASRQLRLKWGDAEGLACLAGPRNRITVVDVDARGVEGERLLADIQAEIGPSRFIVRTGGGGFHAYYRHSGERRKIRIDPKRPIDLLGGGQVVLPPSMGSNARYEIIQGNLDDLTGLTAIKGSARVERPREPSLPEKLPAPETCGSRNKRVFDMLCKEARGLAPQLDAFIERAGAFNQTFETPMGESEVGKIARSVFNYVETGRLRTGEHGAWFRKEQIDRLVRDPPLFALIGWLKAANGPDAKFWIANGLAEKHLGWSEKQLRPVRRRAIDGAWIQMIVPPVKGRNALYRWGTAILGVP